MSNKSSSSDNGGGLDEPSDYGEEKEPLANFL